MVMEEQEVLQPEEQVTEETQVVEEAPVAEAPVVEEPKKKSKMKLLLAVGIPVVLAVVALFCVIVLVVGLYFGIPFVKYQKAVNLMEEGNYDQAVTAFQEMDGYRDSETMILESQYRKANLFMETGNYQYAKEIFLQLDGYGESVEKAKECDYQYALVLMNDKAFEPAIAILEQLGDYKDSAAKITNSQYGIAVQKMEQDDYANALKILETLPGDYDKENAVKECKYQISLGLIEEGQIVAAYEMLLEVGDYKDGLDKQESIQKAYQRNQAKDKLFVSATWNDIYGVRIWLYTKVVDENTMDVIIEGSNGAADQMEERFKGKWDEATGTVQLNGAAYHIVEGKTTVTNQNLTGYIYYENGRAYVVCDVDGELYTRQFKR